MDDCPLQPLDGWRVAPGVNRMAIRSSDGAARSIRAIYSLEGFSIIVSIFLKIQINPRAYPGSHSQLPLRPTVRHKTISHCTAIDDDEEGCKLDRLMNAEIPGLCLVAQAFIHDSESTEALEKLSRYERAIERSLYRALHELQRLHASRKGGATTALVAIDIDVSGSGA